MSRIIKEGVAAINELVHKAEAQLLTVSNGDLDTNNYARYDFLHTGLLIFTDVFIDDKESESQLLYLGGYESDSTLLLPPFTLYLFNECDIAPVKNTAFSFSAATTIADAVAIIDVASGAWKTRRSNGTDTNASLKSDRTVPDILHQKAGSRDLYGIAVFDSDTSGAFQTGAELKLYLGIKYS